ncbi:MULTISPECIES: epoxide hydrolase family protein [unclassified Kitasatospora]|uniref:epoxide hydrolase family protein n=1 Tax=unclassified Kitasatospora TaxID=2633591 RepID=UPI00247569B2|nr:epoxide hydrolase [Kitasatospora sp. MAP12-44]
MIPEGNVEPFRVHFPQADLDDLHERLDRTRWPEEIPGAGWMYGVPGEYLRELARYWRHEYDWRSAESALNEWPQFTTEIDGANIHFAHIRSPEPDATPLLMTHGWPGSVVEFARVAGPLTNPAAHGGDPSDAFHLVLPSIPGFGLSGPTRETGWEFRRVAAAFAELMNRLGYERYGVQGGDWGAAISRELGRTRSEVLGVHLNLIPNACMTHEPTPAELSALSPVEGKRCQESWESFREWTRDKQGYADIQATRPQTLAYGLTDSPVGQLAWIAEKFDEWTDSPVDRDLLLTNVMLYWLTRTAGSSARLYYERAHADYWGTPPEPSTAPTALAHFPHENFVLLRHLAEQTNNIVQWTEYDQGGHFAAMEQPALLVSDIRTFFHSLSDAC